MKIYPARWDRSNRMSLINTILGRSLASNELGEQRIDVVAGVPTFGLDALSSAAYGPEAALTVLLPLGAAGLKFIVPITVAIVVLLGIVYASYRQTIGAYPNGGATVLFVNPWGGLPTRPTASGIDLRIPAVGLWTTRLCFRRALGIVVSTECCHEAWH
jgi:hypothetical protein